MFSSSCRTLVVLPAVVICSAALCGCGGSRDRSAQQEDGDRSAAGASSSRTAFCLDEAERKIYLDTQIAPPQRRRFDIGQGSITLETVQVVDGKLTFRYTPEIEGGYSIYECIVPTSSTPLEFEINSDGTPGKTSVDLKQCEVVFRGNRLLTPIDERIVHFVLWLRRMGATLECTESTGDNGEWKVAHPKASDKYDVIFRIRSFPPMASEAEMRKALDVNLAYVLNARAHLAMSYAGCRGTNPEARPPMADEDLPTLAGLPVTKAIEKWFTEYQATDKKLD